MGKIKASDKIMFENQKKKRKYGNKRYFYIHLHVKDCFNIEFAAYRGELMTENVLCHSASEMTYIVSGGALNSTHLLTYAATDG